MLRLIQNEFIKSFKKVSTIILFVIVLVICLGFTGLMYFAIEQSKEWTAEYSSVEEFDYDMVIQDCKNEKTPGYELEIERWEKMKALGIKQGWKFDVCVEAYSFEMMPVFDENGEITGEEAQFIHTEEERQELLRIVNENDWKSYCKYSIELNKEMGLPQHLSWAYQYRLDNNLPIPESYSDYNWKDTLISRISDAKGMLEEASKAEEKAEYENEIKLGIYMLDNNIRLNVADYEKDYDVEYTIWIALIQSSMLISVIGLLVVVLAGSSIANEFSKGTIKFLLINPVKRWKILVAKYITCILTGYALILVFYGATVLLSMAFFGTADIGADYIRVVNGEIVTTSGLFYIFKTYMLNSVGVLVMATLAFAISSLVRSSALAIGVSVFSLLAGSTIVQLLASFRQDWARFLIWSNTSLSSISAGNSMFPNHSLSFAIGVIVVHMIVYGLIAWDGFVKREV